MFRAHPLISTVMFLRILTSQFLCQLVLSSVLFFAGDFAGPSQTKNPSPSPSPTPEKHEKEEPAEDKVYTAKEVDVKAKVKRPLENTPKPGTDCPGRMRLLVVVRAVLHRSTEVRQVELVKGSGCNSYDEDAIRAVGNMKFTPALKDNRPVSQYQVFEFQYSRF
jgi:TonB family protein